jgi:hypothetical protein
VPRGQRDGSLRPYSRFSRQEPLLFYQVAPIITIIIIIIIIIIVIIFRIKDRVHG